MPIRGRLMRRESLEYRPVPWRQQRPNGLRTAQRAKARRAIPARHAQIAWSLSQPEPCPGTSVKMVRQFITAQVQAIAREGLHECRVSLAATHNRARIFSFAAGSPVSRRRSARVLRSQVTWRLANWRVAAIAS